MEDTLRKMTLEFFGTGSHKIGAEKFLEKENAIFLDVRSKEEADSLALNFGHHGGIKAVNIPINELPERYGELPKDVFIGTFCPASVRSTMAYVFLLSRGYPQVRIIEGGYPGVSEAVKPGKVWKRVKAER